MSYFKFVSVEEAQTKETAERKSELYYKCKVVEDTYAAEQEYYQKYGRKVRLSVGGTTINYAVLANDPSFPLAKEAKEALANGKDVSDILVEGDIVEMQTAADYYVLDNQGKVMSDNGKPRVNNKVRFFCPKGASATTQFRSIQRLLKFVEVTEATPAEPDPLSDSTELGTDVPPVTAPTV